MSGSTIEITLTVTAGTADELVGLFSVLGFEGFWEDGDALRSYIAEERWDDATRQSFGKAIASYASAHEIPLPAASTQIIPLQNWDAAWKDAIKPLRVSPRIIIAPSWRRTRPDPGEIVLTIDPKMSFGTGQHETTRLIIQLLDPRVRSGSTILDVGTGTGILAIAAVALGAGSATGVDIDEWSYANANENIRLNGVEDRTRIILGTLADVPPGMFNIVIANIQRNVIEQMLPQLQSRVVREGTLLLSGLLKAERDDMLGTCSSNGFDLEEERVEQEWIAFALRHRRTP